MKKLMFTAAVAAMTTGAFAGVAQVYDMTINVKTTECKDGKKLVTDKCGNSYRYYRAQASYKFEGKFWGCGCATIAAPIADQYGMPRLNNGLSALEMTCDDNNNSYMFWGAKAAFHHVDFTWPLLQLVGKDSKNVEGYFESEFFGCNNGALVEDASLQLQGAGYGTAYIDQCLVSEDTVAEDYNHAFNYIKSMSGSVVGIYNVADLSGMVGCVYCGEEVGCTPFQFCNCVDLRENESAAYGTFTLKYNSSLANKVMGGKYIDQAYKFKDFVTEEFDCIAANVEPTERTAAEATYDAAKKAYNTAKAASDAADAEAVAAYSVYRVAYTNSYSMAGAMKTALWIDGTNDTAKAVTAMQKASADYRTLCDNENYWALSQDDAVTNAVDTYLADARKYLRKDAELKLLGPVLFDEEEGLSAADQTNRVAELKVKVANDYLALENAIADVTAGQTVKTTFTAAVKAMYDAWETYFNTAIKYVNLTSYDAPEYYTVSPWTKAQLEAVTAAALKDYQAKDAAAQKADAATDDAADTLKTAKIICDATGGDCN